MLANFFNSAEYRKSYEITFSYVNSALYKKGYEQRVTLPTKAFPIPCLDLSSQNRLLIWMPRFVRRVLMALLRLLLTLPLLMYQVFVLYMLFKEIQPLILHINNGGYPAALSARSAAIAGKLAGVKWVVMVVNNMAADYSHYSRWLDYPLDRIVMRCVNIFITGSKAAQSQLTQVLRLSADQSLAIHNGISPRNLTTSAVNTRQRLGLDDFKGVVFGIVALLIPRKGHQVLLNAILHLVNEGKIVGQEFKILIEGDGPLRQELINFVTTNNLTPWVNFVGIESNIFNFMAALDAVILPSIQDEDFPNVILEGMALGKPAIASRLAGIQEQILDGETGFLVEARDSEGLAKALHYFVENPGQLEVMGQVALGRFNDNFTSEIALKNYNNMYESLLKSS